MLGGYQGGLAMKRALLEMEGIRFDDTGRIATKGFLLLGDYERLTAPCEGDSKPGH
jgi:hypothetical protein